MAGYPLVPDELWRMSLRVHCTDLVMLALNFHRSSLVVLLAFFVQVDFRLIFS
jgi:hypothetical protein